jgi:hypothetical protein
MSKAPPPSVKDKSAEAKVFDWRVPIRVGSGRAAIVGTLYWKPEDSGAPTGAFVALGAFCVLVAIVVVVVRRRRRVVAGKHVGAW